MICQIIQSEEQKHKAKIVYIFQWHDLVTIMKDNSIDCFDITGGKLLYTQNKSKTPLSKKHLISSITEFFDGDQQMIKKLCSHIMNSRQQVIKENIKRKIL